jgi:hypothetical protein
MADCPTPPRSIRSFATPAAAPGALRITVTVGPTVVCPQIVTVATITVPPTVTVGS